MRPRGEANSPGSGPLDFKFLTPVPNREYHEPVMESAIPELEPGDSVPRDKRKFLPILSRFLNQPICRAYAKHSMARNEPANRLMTFLVSLPFLMEHYYWPHFRNPRSFSEKVFARMLFDRNPKWRMTTDKLLVREYVADKLGREFLIPMIWRGDRPEEIPFSELPSKFVIKTNHGCGYNIIVKEGDHLDQADAIIRLKKWLRENFCQDKFLGIEWVYKDIRPKIFIETFLDDNGRVPLDYKFFCFSGRVEFILMTFDRHEDPFEKHFDRDFTPLDLWNGCRQYPGRVDRPKNFAQMLDVAEKLAGGFDFIRVDLYNVDGQIFFGELTSYPGGGLARFIPREYDFVFGKKWKIDIGRPSD